jgi:hypothetical protein
VVRDGRPLTAQATTDAVTELVHRALASQAQDPRPVLDWAAGGDVAEIVARHGLSPATLEQQVRAVRAIGAQTPLPSSLHAELSLLNAETEQHRRVRRLFGLRAPRGHLPMRVSRSTDVAIRVLVALGPLPIDVLVGAVNRARQPTAALPAMTDAELENGLRFRAAAYDVDTGVWAAPTGTPAAERDVRLVDTMRASAPLTRVQLHQVLLRVGYTAQTPQSPIVDRNPLIRRTAPNRYELLA